jgi:hypothetical protein
MPVPSTSSSAACDPWARDTLVSMQARCGLGSAARQHVNTVRRKHTHVVLVKDDAPLWVQAYGEENCKRVMPGRAQNRCRRGERERVPANDGEDELGVRWSAVLQLNPVDERA